MTDADTIATLRQELDEARTALANWKLAVRTGVLRCETCEGEGFMQTVAGWRTEDHPDGDEILETELCAECLGTGKGHIAALVLEHEGTLREHLASSRAVCEQRRVEIERLTRERDEARRHYTDVAEAVGIVFEADHKPTVPGPHELILDAAREHRARAAECFDLRRELQNAIANNHRRNVELDALHYVWCDGGCEGGTHRWTEGEITEEIVTAAERNAKRLRSWFVNRQARIEGGDDG